ncbi:MAG TPA: hypothetical protein PK961_15300 [bacterium]|nr:hypothetical protein [bacterium]
MAQYSDEAGNSFTAVSFAVGDPITQAKIGALGANDALLRNCKAVSLPGECSTAVEVVNEAGGVFWPAKTAEQGETFTLVNAAAYGGVTPEEFTSEGLLRRVCHFALWLKTADGASAAAQYLPGGDDDYELFGGNGSDATKRRGFYSGPGSDGGASNYDVTVAWTEDAQDYQLTLWVDEENGDLRAKFNRGGAAGHSHLALVGWIEVSPRLSKSE